MSDRRCIRAAAYGRLLPDASSANLPIPVRRANFAFMAAFEVQRPTLGSYTETDIRP